jgi:murein L,D-transpeptidase YafK
VIFQYTKLLFCVKNAPLSASKSKIKINKIKNQLLLIKNNKNKILKQYIFFLKKCKGVGKLPPHTPKIKKREGGGGGGVGSKAYWGAIHCGVRANP